MEKWSDNFSFLRYFKEEIASDFNGRILLLNTGNGYDARILKDNWPNAKIMGVELNLNIFNESSPFKNDFDLDIVEANFQEITGFELLATESNAFNIIIDNQISPIAQQIFRLQMFIRILNGRYFMLKVRTPHYDLDRVRSKLDRHSCELIDFREDLNIERNKKIKIYDT